MSAPGGGDIAIIGMACVFAGAADLRSFWENILAGVDATGDPPPGWGGDRVLDPSSADNDRLYSTRGGYLGDTLRFDPLKFGVMPRAVDGCEPEHFVALQLADQALADAGYVDRPFDRTRAGVILGRGTYVNRGLVSCFQHTIVVDQVIALLKRLHPEHDDAFLAELKRDLKANLPAFNAETAPGLSHSVMCGRIANRLDLMGPAFTVDAACASGLIAVDYGMRDLRSGVCDLVLAGGIQISTTPPIAMLFAQLGALARSGRIRPFHREADGLLLGEGAGIVVLKRLEDAERDDDRIYAVLKGVGTSSDGKAMGVLAPRVEGEVLAMRRAYESTGIDPESIDLIEAHGTGTPVGDGTEIEAMRRVFGARRSGRRCAMGSVKSMIGHCIPAAAMAGLIKTALALYHRVLPPTLHADAPHPALADAPMYLNDRTRAWIHAGPAPRRAAVSAFGFGGINAHAILEEPDRAAARPAVNLHARRDTELFVVAAPTREALVSRCETLRVLIRRNPDLPPWDLAYSLNCPAAAPDDGEPAQLPRFRLSLVAESLIELDRKLVFALQRLRDESVRRIKEIGGVFYFEERLAEQGGLAFLFPGEGAQYQGMLEDLCIHFPEARDWFDLMDRAFRDHPRGILPSQVMFPPPGPEVDGENRRMWEMASAIESVFAANQAMHAILSGLGIRPQAIVGHSTGEYSALLASGACDVKDEARLIDQILEGNRATERATLHGLVPEGVLLAAGPAEATFLRSLVSEIGGGLFLAMDNCPHQVVLCGDDSAISSAQARLREHGAVCQRLPFERAYHTPLFERAAEELREFYESATFLKPVVPMYSCAVAELVPDDPAAIRRLALEQWTRPVLFRQTVERMHESGLRLFVEVGPRGNLTSFVEDTLRGRPHLAVASNVKARSGITQLHHLLGMLAAHGVPMSLAPLYERRQARRLSESDLWSDASARPVLDRTVRLEMRLPDLTVSDAIVSKASSALPRRQARIRGGPDQVDAEVEFVASATSAGPQGTQAQPSPGDRAMRAYLTTMDRFLSTHEEIMRSALRAAPRPPSAAADPPLPTTWLRAGAPPVRGSDGSLRFHRTLSLDEEIFLRHHTLGGRISEDAAVRALPVLPLACSLELMAEAAMTALPGGEVTSIEGVRAHRWLSFPESRARVEIEVHPAGPGHADVRISMIGEGCDDGGPAEPVVEGTVRIGVRRQPPRPPDEPVSLGALRVSPWTPEQLYAEGASHGMFHGPAFRGVRSLDRVGADGIEGTLVGLPTDSLFRSDPAPVFAIDPLLLDAAGQLFGYWTAAVLKTDFIVFPVEVDRVEFFRGALPSGGTATGRLLVTAVDEEHVVADFDVVDAAGRLLLRASGWRDRRFLVPEPFYRFRLNPREESASESWDPPIRLLQSSLSAACRRVESPVGLDAAEERFWLQGLAWLILDPAEREAWQALGGAARRRTEWLLGRLAAKDAIREVLKAENGPSIFPADIAIVPDDRGRIAPSGLAFEGRGPVPAVSVAHTGGLAVAVAATGVRGIGIDVERLRTLPESFEEVAFGEEERALLQGVHGAERTERVLRLWCAKEAVGKALGTGLAGRPHDMQVLNIGRTDGLVTLRPRIPSFALAGGETQTAGSGRDGDLIYAIAIWKGEKR